MNLDDDKAANSGPSLGAVFVALGVGLMGPCVAAGFAVVTIQDWNRDAAGEEPAHDGG